MTEPRPGKVYLVGAGPGDPGLLTRRGADALAAADVVVYDHLASPRLLDLAPAPALRVCAGKSIGHCTMAQGEINRCLVDHALAGRTVVRLKGGDPYVFGRGGEEAEHLFDLGIPFQVVPGVTSGLGATAYAGIAVTHRESASAVAFVTGHDDPNNVGRLDWPALARFPGTLVIYMGVTRLASICQTLIEGGKPASTPAAMVQAGTLPHQRTVEGTLTTLPEVARSQGVGFPALLVVGEVVARRSRLNWFESLPLFGQRIVVTRPVESADDSARQLEALGAEVLVAPTVEIRPTDQLAALDAAIDRLRAFDWIIFTSGNGVRHFLDRLLAGGRDVRQFGAAKIAAIGPSTAAALAQYHLKADLVPGSARSEALTDALRDQVQGQRVLLARADRGRTILFDELSQVAQVDQVEVYQNADAPAIPNEVLDRIEAGTVDWVTLTSPAITERFHALLPPASRAKIGQSIRLATISPVTSAAARRLGWSVAAEATTFSWDGLVAAIQLNSGRRRTEETDEAGSSSR